MLRRRTVSPQLRTLLKSALKRLKRGLSSELAAAAGPYRPTGAPNTSHVRLYRSAAGVPAVSTPCRS